MSAAIVEDTKANLRKLATIAGPDYEAIAQSISREAALKACLYRVLGMSLADKPATPAAILAALAEVSDLIQMRPESEAGVEIVEAACRDFAKAAGLMRRGA